MNIRDRMSKDKFSKKKSIIELKAISLKIIKPTHNYLKKKFIKEIVKIESIEGNDLVNLMIMISSNIAIREYVYLRECLLRLDNYNLDSKQFIECFMRNFCDGINEYEQQIKNNKLN